MLVSSHVLAEVAQTVDHVLIINDGQLVREARLDELTSTVGGSVRVRSPQAEQLREALAAAEIDVTSRNGALIALGTTAERVGEIAAANGVVLHELVTEESSLEEIFLELTAEPDVVIDQSRAEVLKIRSTRTTFGLCAGHDRDRAPVRAPDRVPELGLAADQQNGAAAKPVQHRQLRRRVRVAGGHPPRHRRVPLRHDHADVPLQPAPRPGRAPRRSRPASWPGSCSPPSARRYRWGWARRS